MVNVICEWPLSISKQGDYLAQTDLWQQKDENLNHKILVDPSTLLVYGVNNKMDLEIHGRKILQEFSNVRFAQSFWQKRQDYWQILAQKLMGKDPKTIS